MKCIGLLGGMSWESTVSYYQALNRGVRERLGGLHSARVLLSSVDFAGIERLQHAGDWPATARLLAAEARAIQAGGADFLLIGTNTMHKVAPEIEAAIDIPLLHIADATGESSQAEYLAIIADLAQAGAQAVILGCTEIALLVGACQAAVPLYDTTAIHAEAAVTLALA